MESCEPTTPPNLGDNSHHSQDEGDTHDGDQNGQHVAGKPASTEKNVSVWGEIGKNCDWQPSPKKYPFPINNRSDHLGARLPVYRG